MLSLLPSPAAMMTEPPVCWSSVVSPAEISTSPPSPEPPGPTRTRKSPPDPWAAPPVPKKIAPELPLLAVPVLIEISPLTPDAPASGVRTRNGPLLASELYPVRSEM